MMRQMGEHNERENRRAEEAILPISTASPDLRAG